MRSLQLLSSVLDRLLHQNVEPQSLAQSDHSTLTETLRRDLSALLNTRRFPAHLQYTLFHENSALTSYGLPEIFAVGIDDVTARDAFLEQIAQQIEVFEPRLHHVLVFVPEQKKHSRTPLEVIIEAKFFCGHQTGTVAFRSIVDPSFCRIQLENSHAERISDTL